MRQTVDVLAVRICQAIREVRSDHQLWVGIDRLHGFLAIDNQWEVDAAVAFASAKGWLAISGSPAHSVLLNPGAP